MISLVPSALFIAICIVATISPALPAPPEAAAIDDTGPVATAHVRVAQASSGQESGADRAARDKAEWQRAIAAELARNRRYPPGAARRDEAGVAVVQFVLARSGQLIDAKLAKSSGFPELDDEALALVKRAKMPPFPATMAESELNFTVPINFNSDYNRIVGNRVPGFPAATPPPPSAVETISLRAGRLLALLMAGIIVSVILLIVLVVRMILAVFRPRPTAEVATPAQSTTAGVSRPPIDFVGRHWRGEYPLWVSYWVVGLCGYIFVFAVLALIDVIASPDRGYWPLAIFGSLIAIWICVVPVTVWQLVGLWRSAARSAAAREAQNKMAVWARLVQVLVVLAILSNVAAVFSHALPQFVETYQIAFQDDPEIPAYSIRVTRYGTEAEITGGLKYSVADDLEKILVAHPEIKTVHLDSPGGRLGEAEKLFWLIRKRGLDTSVSSECASACTLAFAGGRNRYLHGNGALGFHRGTFAGFSDWQSDDAQRRIFQEAGIDRSFIAKALSTPNKDIWVPSTEMLVRARVVTRVITGWPDDPMGQPSSE